MTRSGSKVLQWGPARCPVSTVIFLSFLVTDYFFFPKRPYQNAHDSNKRDPSRLPPQLRRFPNATEPERNANGQGRVHPRGATTRAAGVRQKRLQVRPLPLFISFVRPSRTPAGAPNPSY